MVHIDSGIAEALSNKRLQLTLMPTEKCNFRCTYCYEKYELDKMPIHIIEAIKDIIEQRSKNLESLFIGWFGGEPLLAKTIIYDIMNHAYTQKKKHSQLNVYSAISTNGYLLDHSTLRKLIKVGIKKYQITLDGDQDQHNRTRVLINGNGTFNRIWANLIHIRQSDYDITINLRIHFSPSNYMDLLPLIHKINYIFGNDRRFAVYFKPISRWGGRNDETIELCSPNQETMISSFLTEKLHSPEMIAEIYSHGQNQICEAAKANTFIVRPNGDLLKCTIAIYDPINHIGKITKEKEILIDNRKLHSWTIGLQTGNVEALQCPYALINN